jgi:ribonuclease VapC
MGVRVAGAVLDASALLAVVFREPGAEVALPLMPGAYISAVNLSEVIARCVERGKPIDEAITLLGELPIIVVSFGAEAAYRTAGLKVPTRHLGLSFADRCCLALGAEKHAVVLTTDTDWSKLDLGIEIRQLR